MHALVIVINFYASSLHAQAWYEVPEILPISNTISRGLIFGIQSLEEMARAQTRQRKIQRLLLPAGK